MKDVARAIQFYRDQLRIPFLFEAPGLAFFQCGDIMLMLGKPETAEFDHPSGVLYFQVEDISAAHPEGMVDAKPGAKAPGVASKKNKCRPGRGGRSGAPSGRQ